MAFSEENKKITISWGLLITIVIAVFYSAGVYYKFSSHDAAVEGVDKKLVYVNDRFNRKFERLEGKVEELEKRVRALEVKSGCGSNTR